MNLDNQSLDLAVRYHQSGNLQQAERIYRQILQTDPTNVDAHHLLGLIALQVGQTDAAIDCIRQTLRLKPDFAEAHYNLGMALRQHGQLPEAMAHWRQAIHLKPDYAEALHTLANALMDAGQFPEAEVVYQQTLSFEPNSFRALNNLGFALIAQGRHAKATGYLQEAVRLKPDYIQAHNNLGNALVAQGKQAEAFASYQRALSFDRNFAPAYNNLGKILLEQHRLGEAVANFQQALQLKPDFVEALNNLGNACLEQGQLSEAVGHYQNVLRLKPSFAAAYSNLGKVFLEQEQLDDAVAILRQALQVDPKFAEAHNNLGLVLQEQGKIPEAIACFQSALRINPKYAEAHKCLGMAWLLAGNCEQGWPEYEWRLLTEEFPLPTFRQPRWDGALLGGRTILLQTEQGFGDTLQFIRYAQLLKHQGGAVLVSCQPALVRLLSSCPGIDQLIANGDSLPDFDVQTPLMSLPRILSTSLASIPVRIPYLFADSKLVEQWRPRFQEPHTFKIGIAWQGNPNYRRDRQRSIPLQQFAPLARLERIQLFSLQRGLGTEQIQASAEQVPVTIVSGNLDEAAGPFMDTAAVMKHLDLVITSDTAIAHLAGALDVPVWLALPFAPDWRWLLQREDSPWYPTMRLFRQPEPGNWQAVFKRMAVELRKTS